MNWWEDFGNWIAGTAKTIAGATLGAIADPGRQFSAGTASLESGVRTATSNKVQIAPINPGQDPMAKSLFESGTQQSGTGTQTGLKVLQTVPRAASEYIAAGVLAAPSPFTKDNGLSYFDALDLTQGNRNGKIWYESGEDPITLGQSLYGTGQTAFGGKKLDWTDTAAVKKYFSEGAAKYTSGTIDAAASIGLDPLTYIAPAAKAGRLAFFVQPLSDASKVEKAVAGIDQAVLHVADNAAAEANSWVPTIKFILDNPKASTIQMRANIYESTNAIDLSSALEQAALKQDVELIGDILKVSVGDEAAISKLVARRDAISAQIKQGNIKRAKVSQQLEDAITVKADPEKIQSLKDLEKSFTEDLNTLIKDNLVYTKTIGTSNEANIIIDPVTGSKSFESVGDGVKFSMNGRTVARSKYWEEARNVTALSRANTTYSMAEINIQGVRARVLGWISPSGLIKETPSGTLNIGGMGYPESYREVVAIASHAKYATGKNYSFMVDEYSRMLNASDRSNALQKFEEVISEDIINYTLAKGRKGGKLSEREMKYISALAKKLTEQKFFANQRGLVDTIENNFIILDESGDPVIVDQLKEYITKVAALENRTYEQEVEILRRNPQYSGQVSSFYSFMDIDRFAKHIAEYKPALEAFLKHVDNMVGQLGDDVSKKALDKEVKSLFDSIINNPLSAMSARQKTMTRARESQEFLTDFLDGFYGNLWKPLTLISGKYAVRNVLEGSLRTLAYMDELASVAGESRLRIFNDWADKPMSKIEIIKDNAIANIKSKQGLAKLKAKKDDSLAAIGAQDVALATSAEKSASVIAQTSKMSKSLTGLNEKEIVNALKVVSDGTKIFPTVKNPAARAAVDYLAAGRTEEAVKALYGGKNLGDTLADINKLKKLIDNAVNAIETPLKNGDYLDKHSDIIVENIDKMYKNLQTLSQSLENIGTAASMRAAAAGEWDKLIAGAQPILRRSGADTFEVIPGTIVPDWAAGQLGKFARLESSADATYVRAIQDSNRLIGRSVLEQSVRNAKVEGTSEKWAGAYADFINGDLKSDPMNYLILSGASKAKVKSWFMSTSADAYRSNLDLSVTLKDFERQYVKNSELIDFYLPEVPGTARNTLKKKALAGDITREDAQLIPNAVRPTVSGADTTYAGTKDAFSTWKRIVSKTFKVLGSTPETVLVRHPFYRAVYRTEARRIARIMQAQGIDINNSQNAMNTIVRASHRAALKATNETLYTIARYTDPAKFLRFASPFYMSQQNSNRFWIGQAVKNPTAPYIGFLSWNTVNKVVDVVDEDGNPVDVSLPFGTNETLRISVPDWLLDGNVAGNQYFQVSKTSLDLVNQGSIPLVPSMSGSMVSLPANWLLDFAASKGKPVPEILTDLGFDGDLFEKRILPYFDPYAQQDFWTSVLPQSAWMRAARNSFGNTPAFAARVNLLFEQKMYRLDLSGKKLTNKIFTKFLADATNEARASFQLEAFSAAFSPASVKLTPSQQILKESYRRYTSEYGQIEGFQKYTEDFGAISAAYASSSLSKNNSGLFASPQTQGNLKRNRDLAGLIAATGPEGLSFLGEMFNEGDTQDYSKVVNEYFYNEKINGVPLKEQNEDLRAANAKRQSNIGWALWIPYKNMAVKHAEARGITVGSKAWDNAYAPALRSVESQIANKYPDWAIDKASFDTDKGRRRYMLVETVVKDEQFMSTIGKKRAVWQAAEQWVGFRNYLAEELKQRIAAGRSGSLTAKSNADILNAMEVYAAALGEKYVEFPYFYERYLSKDNLKAVN